ncbi:MAG TPA: TIGR04282 family arsenosugar biosynthesis glycosyltransferase [Blastocatellia bacterium]|nr:TIGR04282 family arsenosugar biosynthesis glycosyltransferase [Blastocatellia bacterium]
MRKTKQALVIFAKAPEFNKVKTRLVPPLTPVQATELYRCFLLDTIENVSQIPGVDVIISYTPKGTEHLFHELAPQCRLLLQEGDSFGPRLFSCFQNLCAEGYESVLVMDTDSPTLPHKYLEEGFEYLAAREDAGIIGPSADGGYYVIGLKKPHRAMFENITWSTEYVTAESLEQADKIGLPIHLLPEWFDVDTEAELAYLERQILNGSIEGYSAPHTRAFFLKFRVQALACHLPEPAA